MSILLRPEHAAQLKAEQVIEWLKDLDRNGCLGVGFGGGEPTLHRDFAALCKFAATNTGLAVTFTTHAHRLNDRIKADLQGYVHFVRVSMDGVGSTYETLRGKSFIQFLRQLETIRALAPFGINFVVNALTFPDIDRAIQLALESGATEFLLLPERRTHAASGIDHNTREALRTWVRSFRGNIRLSVSEIDAAGLPIYNPLPGEKGLRSYAHIDASGILKRSSFEPTGVPIGSNGISRALTTLDHITEMIQ